MCDARCAVERAVCDVSDDVPVCCGVCDARTVLCVRSTVGCAVCVGCAVYTGVDEWRE